MNRKIDELGRIVIPKEIRNYLNIKYNDCFAIEIKDNSIVLTKEFDLEEWLNERIANEMDTMKRLAFKEVLEVIKK